MNQPMMELPKYKSHKVVRALSIAAIEVHEDKSATIAPSLAQYAPFKTQPGWAERFKGSEDDKGYYVVYDDGYSSWSPTAAFESGYAKLGDEHTPLSDLKAALHADEDYAWTWLCNLACIGIDSISDIANLDEGKQLTPHEAANRRAAQFMSHAFDLDIRTSSQWKALEAQWSQCAQLDAAFVAVTRKVVSEGMVIVRAKRLIAQVMKTWNPPRNGLGSAALVAQSSAMLAIAYVMGRDFLPDMTADQQAAIDIGLAILNSELKEGQNLEKQTD